MLKRTLVVLALASFTLPVAAQRGNGAPAVERHDFDDPDEIEGTLRRPDGDPVLVRTLPDRHSLIRVRTSFVPELTKSVERR